MTATAKDLRFNISFLFDVLGRGESVTITHRGKPKATLVPCENAQKPSEKDSSIFGMWSDKSDDVDTSLRGMRKGRSF